MNVIFLDIDGVLNCQVFYEKTVKEAKKELKKQVKKGEVERLLFYKKQIDPERMTWLNHLCTETNSVVVVSSTWRKGNAFEELKNILAFCGATFKIVDVTPYCLVEIEAVKYPHGGL
jgi:DTW domain-containing protein YfiP